MSNALLLDAYRSAVEAWASDGYFADIRYIARVTATGTCLWDAFIGLSPIRPTLDNSFELVVGGFRAGQKQITLSTAAEFKKLLDDAAAGILSVGGFSAELQASSGLELYSELASRDSWFNAIHLQVSGDRTEILSQIELARADTEFRSAATPFDGLADLAGWLSLRTPGSAGLPASINIRVNPPIDIILDECTLTNDKLKLTVHALPTLDLAKVQLSVRSSPGDGLQSRRQVSGALCWQPVDSGLIVGIADILLPNSDQAIAMLMLGTTTIRRHWFLDPQKARNGRLLAVQHFDKELRMLRIAALKGTDSPQFERAIAGLLFLLGFNPAVQVETDAPDIVVSTPSGRLVLVECTLRTSDFAVKVGKLIDRRASLMTALSSSNHPVEVFAALVCRVPIRQLSVNRADLNKQNVLLVTEEGISGAFERLRAGGGADELLDAAMRATSAT